MAQAQLNSALAQLRGRIGDLVYKRYGDKLVVTRVPTFSGDWSKSQRDGRRRFSLASQYAEKVRRTPSLLEVYTQLAKARRLSVRAAAIADYLTAVRVTAVDLDRYHGSPGQTIWIKTADRHKAVAVDVILRTARGRLIERGAATGKLETWAYRATKRAPADAPLSIEVTATDRLGRKATAMFEGECGTKLRTKPVVRSVDGRRQRIS